MANTSIKVPVDYSLREEMAFWDTLPTWMREFLSELPIVMSPVDAYNLWFSGDYATPQIFMDFIWGEVIYWMNYELDEQDYQAERKRTKKKDAGKHVRELRIVLPKGFWPRVRKPIEPLRPAIGRYAYSPSAG